MKYVYCVYMYSPKHKYGYTIYEGRYLPHPRIFETLQKARDFKKQYKHVSYIRKAQLK